MATYRFDRENAKRKPGIQSIGSAIADVLKRYNLERKFDETYLMAHWEKVIGRGVASRTTSLYVKDGVLFLGLSSSVMAQELVIAKRKLIQKLNDEFGYELIRDIVFV